MQVRGLKFLVSGHLPSQKCLLTKTSLSMGLACFLSVFLASRYSMPRLPVGGSVGRVCVQGDEEE